MVVVKLLAVCNGARRCQALARLHRGGCTQHKWTTGDRCSAAPAHCPALAVALGRTFCAASRTSQSTKRCPRGMTNAPALFLVDSSCLPRAAGVL